MFYFLSSSYILVIMIFSSMFHLAACYIVVFWTYISLMEIGGHFLHSIADVASLIVQQSFSALKNSSVEDVPQRTWLKVLTFLKYLALFRNVKK